MQRDTEQKLAQQADQQRLTEKFNGETILEKMHNFLKNQVNAHNPTELISKESSVWKILKPWLKNLSEEELPLVLRYGKFSNSIKEGKF